MNDLLTRLSALGTSPAPVDETTVAADVRRGRRALRRRRAARIAAGGVFALAIAGTGTVLTLQSDHGDSQPAGAPLRLVDYTGAQPAGFTVATVPSGFVVQGVNSGSLDITRPDDTSSLDSFVGKIVVMLQSKDAHFRQVGTRVSVHGHPGYIHQERGGATMLEYVDGRGNDVVVQAWDDLKLTDQQLVQLAEGVTVTSAAQAPVG